MNAAGVGERVIQEQAVHDVARIVVLLNVAPAACKSVVDSVSCL
jgi:hypothetical protein